MMQKLALKTESENAQDTFLPNFCSIRMVFAVVISAQLLAIVLVLGSGRPAAQFWHALSLTSLYVQWVALAGAAVLCSTRKWLTDFSHSTAGILAWVMLMLVTAGISEIAFYLFSRTGEDTHLDPDGHLGLLWKSLGISGILSALMLRYLYMHYLWRKQAQAESEARLQALQSRIRPHFLFNSMNTIASLTRSQPHLAAEVVQDLADLFRVSLRDVARVSTLSEELEFARRFLNIELLRLSDRLRVEWDLRDLPGAAAMPSLVLQPLVENAIFHGIEPALEPGCIRIHGSYHQRTVELVIFNSVPTEPQQSGSRAGNQLALRNIRQRLSGVFMGEASLEVSRPPGGYQITLKFPFPWKEQ